MTKSRRTQAARRAETKASLLSAARALFLENGYDSTSTPEIVAKAGVTRGALYHHFEDKKDLFRALVTSEAAEIARVIDERTHDIQNPQQGMIEGTNAYFDAMAVPGRAKLVLSDAASILGHAEAVMLTKSQGSEELKDGLRQATPNMSEEDLIAMTNVLSAAFDRAALEIAEGASREPYVKALVSLIERATA